MRNGIAHRYEENHSRFFYKGKSILYNYSSLVKFLIDCSRALNEISDLVTDTLDAIDKAEKELG
jgi:hypothetical protein